MDEKYCSGCDQTLPIESFRLKKHKHRFKRESKCTPCANKRKNEWAERNRDRLNAYNKQYYAANGGKIRTAASKWKKANPALANSHARKHTARVLGNKVEDVDYALIYERDNWICQLCFQPVDETINWPDVRSKSIDHKTPVSKGGAHSYENVQLAHLGCNLSKSDRLVFTRDQGLSPFPIEEETS